ncbi:MAG: hypothetical protein ACR2Q4_04340 [Geminicoccaceae bacterium]
MITSFSDSLKVTRQGTIEPSSPTVATTIGGECGPPMLDAVIFSEELTEKVFAFVEREAGHDVPLSIVDEALVRELLESDPVARSFADNMRAINGGLGMLLGSVDDIELPDELVMLIRAHGDLRNNRAGGAVTSNGDHRR